MAEKDKKLIEKILKNRSHTGEDFTGQNLSGLDLQGKDFTGASFEKAKLKNSNLAWCNFSGCNITGSDFTNSNLSNVNFTGSQINYKQIINHASILIGEKFCYGFLCVIDKDRKTIFVNENGKESEYKQSEATFMARVLYQLLMTVTEDK